MHRILVIDDDPSVGSFLRRGLKLEGYTVEVVSEGPAGLAQLRKFRPDLVILDQVLVGMSGLEVLEKLRQAAPELPVIMFSGRDEMEEAIGVDAYLVKPVAFDVLIATVRRLLPSGNGSSS
ncbi:MAG: hypothetical protein C4332_13770 [Meiothermus sp.]